MRKRLSRASGPTNRKGGGKRKVTFGKVVVGENGLQAAVRCDAERDAMFSALDMVASVRVRRDEQLCAHFISI